MKRLTKNQKLAAGLIVYAANAGLDALASPSFQDDLIGLATADRDLARLVCMAAIQRTWSQANRKPKP